ncbi:MAG TPA: hypothetical protein VG817_04605 [Gemmatimonadales bacterium]|nr:hypothetical protein [Gemmatimonadales bacterium]
MRWLLDQASPDKRERLTSSIETLAVVDACDCGCPSVDFVREGQGAGAQIVTEASGSLNDGTPVTVLLWSRDGVISGLEVFNYDGGTWFPLPSPTQLHPASEKNRTIAAS